MDTKYLQYFVEIAKRKSFSKASEYLFISQPTLSQFLAKEENELGVKLFLRNKSELSLTKAGELYLNACQDILKRKDELYRDLSAVSSSKTGKLSLGITPQWGADMFAEILPYFKLQYPNFLLKSTEGNVKPLIEALSTQALDLAVVALEDDSLQFLHHDLLCSEEFVLAAPASCSVSQLLSSQHRYASLKDFQNEPFIISCSGTTIRDIQNKQFSQNKLRPDITCEINSMASTLKMISSGLGVSIIPKSYQTENPKIRFHKLDPSPFWNICIVFRKGFAANEAENYLIQLITDYFSSYKK